jgi:hypothetical protein
MRNVAPSSAAICSKPIQYMAACSALWLLCAWTPRRACAASDVPQGRTSARQIVASLVANEDAASRHRDHYMYLSQERSDRTGGHLWTEKAVETSAGLVRMLLSEDGKPLNAERIAQERRWLADIVADPAAFAKKSHAREDDEEHARQMESLVTRVFNFSDVRTENGYLRIDFAPNPEYKTQSFEERVMHGISGKLLIDPQTMRLRRMEGRLPQDVSIGFGILAKFRAGSGFVATRDQPGLPEWKTTEYDTFFSGRILFFKSIVRNAHAIHSNFVHVPYDMSVAQAVAMVEQ